jgi:PII-like signaling protein
MLKPGPARKVTVYVDEDVHHQGEPLYVAVLNYLFALNVSGATVTKGVAGFGPSHRVHTTRLLEVSGNLPVKIEFVEQSPRLDDILAALSGIVTEGLIEVQETTIVAATRREKKREA